jgi:hypothetical protein
MLERDFASTADFVEPHPLNYNTFSDRYAGLILLIGSETDVVAKRLVAHIDASSRNDRIGDYQKAIVARYPQLHTIEVSINRYGLSTKPWSSWESDAINSPIWWKAYNKVKHSRLENIQEASQKNVIDSLCGLFLLNMYLYSGASHIWPSPQLLGEEYFSPIIVDRPEKILPGI